MAEAINSQVAKIYIAKQSARGVPAAIADRQLSLLEGSIQTEEDIGKQSGLDGNVFGRSYTRKKSITSTGELVLAATPQDVSYSLEAFFGNKTESDGVIEIDSNSNSNDWYTVWQPIGDDVGSIKRKFSDCKVGAISLEGTSDQDGPVTITITVLGLQVETYLTDPVVSQTDLDEPWDYTDLCSNFSIAEQNVNGLNSLILSGDRGTEAVQGACITPHMLVPGESSLEISANLLLDTENQSVYNLIRWSDANPPAGTKPSNRPYSGPVEFKYSYTEGGITRDLSIEASDCQLSIDGDIEPSAEGGAIELTVNGDVRRQKSGEPAMTVRVSETDDSVTPPPEPDED